MNEHPPARSDPPVNPPFTAIHPNAVGGYGSPKPDNIAGVVNPLRGEGGPLSKGVYERPFRGRASNIEKPYIGFTNRFTPRPCIAVLSGEPPVHRGFTGFTGSKQVLNDTMNVENYTDSRRTAVKAADFAGKNPRRVRP